VRSGQIAAESDGHGAFSTYLAGALEGGAADIRGNVSLAGTYAYLAECFGAWDQRPTMKANLDDSCILRQIAPYISADDLRRLPAIFSTAAAEFQLDPTYERESETAVPEHVAIYDVLTSYRNTRLIEMVGAEHLYHAAVHSKACRLTHHGRHYWMLADKNLV